MASGFVCTSFAFERDVHFGLTKYLALRAGFAEAQAQAIALGNQFVDSGDTQFFDFATAYACVGHKPEDSRVMRRLHFPSEADVPATPTQREVKPGSDAALAPLEAILKIPPDQAALSLYRLGAALHVLQDSWAYQGVPDVPDPLPGAVACDPSVTWAPPAARGGWQSHRADLTWAWTEDTIAMASKSYQALQRYPRIGGLERKAIAWNEIESDVLAFAKARTKLEKQTWFEAQGVQETAFLDGVSLPDGTRPFRAEWTSVRIPTVTSLRSRQHRIPPDLLDFLGQFFEAWLSRTDFEQMAVEFTSGPESRASAKATAGAAAPTTKRTSLMALKLEVWRMRDHGAVADIAHSMQTPTANQMSRLRAVRGAETAYASYSPASRGVLPYLQRTDESVPLLPYLTSILPADVGGELRAVATVKLRHVPYDEIEVLVGKRQGSWRVVDISAMVVH